RDSKQNRAVTLPLHKAIHDAILARDTARARDAMQAHLDDTERRRAALMPLAEPMRKATKRRGGL
ncbi:MAG TPA: FCD domain-containing protein, partial [Candidatus Saccharimonadales bacterium]|nr:FCD domain-containing protein [Candidatus Saccharimonadales bacterium]